MCRLTCHLMTLFDPVFGIKSSGGWVGRLCHFVSAKYLRLAWGVECATLQKAQLLDLRVTTRWLRMLAM